MATAVTKTYKITNALDDGYCREEYSTDGENNIYTLYNDSSNVRIGESSTYAYHGYFLFRNIDIPSYATINSAYIRLKAQETDSNDGINVEIHANKNEIISPPLTADEFKTMYYDMASWFTNTKDYVKWDIDNISINSWYKTFDISSLISSCINQSWWQSGKNILLSILDWFSFGIFNFYSLEADPTYAPELVITYTIENYPPVKPDQFITPLSDVTLDAGSVYTLKWSPSTDADSNLAGYYIYQSIDNGEYIYLATATNTQYTITIPDGGYINIKYKIIAYDTKGANSEALISPTITIINNAAPSIIIKDIENNAIINNQNVSLSSSDDFIIKITPNDTDNADTLQYSIIIRGITYVPYAPCIKNTQISYTIPYGDLMFGNNIVQVKVKDNKGKETIVNFNLKNGVPDSLDFRSVLQILQSFGHTNTNYSCLNDIKPLGYSQTVLSLSDILNSL